MREIVIILVVLIILHFTILCNYNNRELRIVRCFEDLTVRLKTLIKIVFWLVVGISLICLAYKLMDNLINIGGI